MARNYHRLMGHMNESVGFISSSIKEFDIGNEPECKRLATQIRILLHDTSRSKSLLSKLGIKDRIEWMDSSLHRNPNNLLTAHGGLVLMKFSADGGGSYQAPLDALSPGRINPPLKFEPWWTQQVMFDVTETALSRKDIVMILSNKEGGAHVDPELDFKYESFVTRNGLWWMTGEPESSQERPFGSNPLAMAMRQITHEFLRSIKNQLELLHPDNF